MFQLLKINKNLFLRFFFLAFCAGTCSLFSQHENEAASSLYHDDNHNELSVYFIEPAILVNPAVPFFGIYEAGVSVLAGRRISSSLAVSSFTGAKTRFFKKDGMRKNLDNNYYINMQQLLGFQFFFGENNNHIFGFLGGLGFMRYKESIVNPDAGLNHTYTSPWILSPSYGIFYQSIFAFTSDTSFLIRFYLPLTHRFTMMENVLSSSLEFGVHFHL